MSKKSLHEKNNERVMVVSREELFNDGIWYGVKTKDIKKYINLISKKHKFLPRSKVEQDPSWQQIIPYLVFESGSRFFLMRRKGNHTDRRLSNMYSLGIGGHINKKDIEGIGRRNIISWARREFEEEIAYSGKFTTEFVGLLNDDSNDVGLVHLGLDICIRGESDNIAIRDEHKTGNLIELSGCAKYYKRMETWSKIVYDFLRDNKKSMKKSKVGMVKAVRVQVSGILPDRLIEEYIEKGFIKISSLEGDWKKHIDHVSIDFHLGTNLKLFKAGAYRFIDTRRGLPDDAMEEVNLQEGDPFI